MLPTPEPFVTSSFNATRPRCAELSRTALLTIINRRRFREAFQKDNAIDRFGAKSLKWGRPAADLE